LHAITKYRAILLTVLQCVWCIAQAEVLPGISQPGQVEKQFNELPELKSIQPKTTILPEIGQKKPKNSSLIKFTLNGMVFSGNTVYTDEQLVSNYKQLLNKEVSLDDVYKIANEIVNRYRNDGFILANVILPAQTIENGSVSFQIIEGYIADIKVSGGSNNDQLKVKEYLQNIADTKPLSVQKLERVLLLINDMPGVGSTAVIKPSENIQGASELSLKLMSKGLFAGISADNRGGRIIGPIRINSEIKIFSSFDSSDVISLRFVTTPDKELNFISAGYDKLVSDAGGKLSFQYQFVKSQPEDIISIPLNIETESQSGSLTYSYPVVRSRSENLSLRAGLAIHSGKTIILGEKNSKDDLRILRLGLSYDKADSYRGINFLDTEFSKGIQGLGSSKNHDALLSRADGNVDFSKVNLSLGRLQGLANNFSVLAAANLQYAFTDLLASELYGYGGEQFGRGYDPSELVGDHGWAAKVELRYDDKLNFLNTNYTAYGFYDAGQVYQRKNDSAFNKGKFLSTGLGLRLKIGDRLNAFTEIAQPINHDVAAERSKDLRLYLGFSIRL
jgi:hemolysin activation/secretion protein